ncbi:hypothetical protein TNCV_1796841 [Trichonephila clavipes]|nr:hypothetical protein TNCV_1796841 [Trichonephila clavipes]
MKSRLRTVWLDTLRPVAKSNCLCSSVAFSVLFRRAVNCIYRSSVDVVARGRPAPGRRLTFPVSWNRFPSLATTLIGDSNSVRDTTLCQSAYNTPCHGGGIPANDTLEQTEMGEEVSPHNSDPQLQTICLKCGAQFTRSA